MLLGGVLGIAAESGVKPQKTGFGVLQQEEVSIGDPLEVIVQFVDEANGEVIGEQEVVLKKGNNSYNDLQKYVELLSGYELCQSGDFWFDEKSERPLKVEVRKVVTSKQINVTFIDAQGNNVGGGDATVDADGDGNANYSELADIIPEGYKTAESGDFQVEDGGHYDIKVLRDHALIINISFVTPQGKVIKAGDQFIDADGDGIANYSELEVPEGYRINESGDFFVAEAPSQLTIYRNGPIAIGVTYWDPQGNSVGGGDYFVDEDGDGIASYAELEIPEGYKINESGDFFVDDAPLKLTVYHETASIINVVYFDEQGDNIGGGDYFVDDDGDGIANYAELLLPVGYELIETGDFFVDENNTYEITLRLIETTLTVTFEDEEGNVVDTVTMQAGVPGSSDDTHHFVLGKDFNLPEGYELADLGYEQTTDIEIHYGSTGGITLVVKKVKEVTPSTPSEKPGKVNISCAGLSDKNCDGVVTCDEAMGEGWTWNNAKGVCEYTGSYTVVNTGVK